MNKAGLRKPAAAKTNTAPPAPPATAAATSVATSSRSARKTLQLANVADVFTDDEDTEKLIDATLKVCQFSARNQLPRHQLFPLNLVSKLCKNIEQVLQHVPAKNNFIMYGVQVYVAATESSSPFKSCKSQTECGLLACGSQLRKGDKVGFAFIVENFVTLRLAMLESIVCGHHLIPSFKREGCQHANRISAQLHAQDSGIQSPSSGLDNPDNQCHEQNTNEDGNTASNK